MSTVHGPGALAVSRRAWCRSAKVLPSWNCALEAGFPGQLRHGTVLNAMDPRAQVGHAATLAACSLFAAASPGCIGVADGYGLSMFHWLAFLPLRNTGSCGQYRISRRPLIVGGVCAGSVPLAQSALRHRGITSRTKRSFPGRSVYCLLRNVPWRLVAVSTNL